MRLLLSGGGNPEQVVDLDIFFSRSIDKNKPILYIPIAMDKIPYEDCENWFRSSYKKYGITNIDLCTDLKNCKDLNMYSAIFIGGGNTFKLLKEIRESSFNSKLIDYLNNEGFVYGGSAGAIIFGANINTAIHADKNNVNLKDLTGINILNNYNIWCHYDIKNDKEELSKIEGKTIVLYEESGVFFDGKNFNSIGKQYEEISKELGYDVEIRGEIKNKGD